MLLLTFAFALGEEAFGDSRHLIACQGGFSISSEASHDESSFQKNCGEQGQEKQSQKCSDPCHVGQSHFGHCSFLAANSALNYPAFSHSCLKSFLSLIMVEGPTLEGLRRPPRQA